MLSSIILAISVSVDSLGIGITYGIKDTKISYIGKVILFCISFLVTIVSIWFGDNIKNIFSDTFAKFIGSSILILMGTFIIYQAINKKENPNVTTKLNDEKIFSFFIKFLGITIQIIKDPNYSDFDNSHKIDSKESFFLGLALSLDAFCIGVGGSIIGLSSGIFPFLVGLFQLIFLSIGMFLGIKVRNLTIIPDNTWSIISGLLLVCIGLFKLF